MRNFWIMGGLVMFLGLFVVACGDDDGGTEEPDGGGRDCVEGEISYGTVCKVEIDPCKEEGASQGTCNCINMEECNTGFCEVYSVMPWSQDSQCAAAPPADTTRFTGIVRDFESNDVLSDVDVSFADGATVLLDPNGAYGSFRHFQVTSGTDGTFNYDFPWDVQSGDMGIVSLIKKDGYFFSGTGFVEPTEDRKAPTGSLNHHAMVISESMVATLKALAAADPAAAKYNPNVFGKVLYTDLVDGDGKPVPVQGTTIKNITGSNMEIFYVNEEMTGLDACATASHGMFILARPATKDKVRTFRGTTEIGYYDNTMGDTPQDLVYLLVVPVYSGDDPEAPAVNCP